MLLRVSKDTRSLLFIDMINNYMESKKPEIKDANTERISHDWEKDVEEMFKQWSEIGDDVDNTRKSVSSMHSSILKLGSVFDAAFK